MSLDQAENFLKSLRDDPGQLQNLTGSPSVFAFFEGLVDLGQQAGHQFDVEEAMTAFANGFEATTGSKTTVERLLAPHPLEEELEGEELAMTVRIAPLELIKGMIQGNLFETAAYCSTTYKWVTKKCS